MPFFVIRRVRFQKPIYWRAGAWVEPLHSATKFYDEDSAQEVVDRLSEGSFGEVVSAIDEPTKRKDIKK